MHKIARKTILITLCLLILGSSLLVGKSPVEAYTYPIRVVTKYNTQLPDLILKNLKYTRYTMYYDYILITASGANIRALPSASSSIIGKSSYGEKLKVLSKVEGQYVSSYNTDLWYEVTRTRDGKTIRGYILSKLALKRNFQFQKMSNAVVALKKEVDNGLTAYISNYKNSNGSPPLHNGSTYDAFGTRRYQSAPAYYAARSSSDFRYITDGTLVTILGTSGNYYKVRTLNFAGTYYVPQWYVSRRNSIDKLTKVIVVDRKYQNEGVFEYINGRWNLISYTYATTGENAKYKLPTDLGYYMVIAKSSMFIYRDDITKEIAGYAPHVLRFSGGSYVHGVPVNIPSRYIVNGQITYYPPKIEYSSVIGTFPRSHKCVRNYTSHALFLYNWSVLGKTAVIVIE